MTHRKIGSDSVFPISYGAMGLVAFYGPKATQEHASKVLSHVVNTSKGKVMIDTSDMYTARPSLGENEEMIGEWLKNAPADERKRAFIATKHVITVGPEGMGFKGGKDYALSACAASLKRLGVDQIDLYYAHRPTPEFIGTQEGLKQLKEEGKIRHIGVSEYSLEQLEQAEKIAHIDALQIELSPWTPDIVSNGILKWTQDHGVTVVAYSPVGRGFLTGEIKSRSDLDPSDWRLQNERFSEENFPKNVKLVDELKKIADKKGCTAAQISLAWVLAQGDNIIAIPGSTKTERVTQNAEAAHIKLTKEELQEINNIIKSFKASGARYPAQMMKTVAF